MTEANSIQTFVTSADGTRISVTVTGQGRPLVLVHGSLSTSADWQRVADSLADHMTTYAIDRRGYGSSGDAAAYSVERERDDVVAVLQLAGPAAILFGHSFGGFLAGSLALNHVPAAAILYEPPFFPPGPVAGEEALAAYDSLLADGDLDEALALGMRAFVQAPEADISAFRSSPAWKTRTTLAPTWAREMHALDAFDSERAPFARITCPTLALRGEYSPDWLREGTRLFQKALPDARLVDLPGQGHDAAETAPSLLAREVLNFVRTLPA
ncbi:alpha/beta fold hydrolase [Streptomyces prunicolor]|uniref:Alpha/beta hydrolase n=1 Tax=Streptomyces prunicolor TaxID=67348 RepID=A0ABU4F199_9ACTN|nr:alpha/beta hydrolase [Streptomyces prunicolor]MCX5243298.1 alpha/beta hydrolase [Streptomyces prunicolor]MDV7214369.1 alpha/beta hydrolase [Streptomyces prunicolor]